jgi:LPS export ABC transporter protein LptC
LFVYSCENDAGVINAWNEKVIMVEEAKNITSFFSQGGNRKAKLTAPLMLRYQADSVYVEFPKSLHVNFYNEQSQLESYLDAKYGKYMETQNKVLLRDSVIVINVSGDTLRTSELWWDQVAKIFYTDKQVRIVTADKRIRGGKGLEAAQDMTWYKIKYPEGTILVEDDILPQ